ncbi:MAG: hypothetical protein M3O06_04810, partial [Pseudomonadota bacterium]|nr:hypothetical protein [Pseudomonadota bacterium]
MSEYLESDVTSGQIGHLGLPLRRATDYCIDFHGYCRRGAFLKDGFISCRHCKATGTRSPPALWGLWILSLGLASSTVTFAAGTVSPYAAVAIEHDTNIFDLSAAGPAPVGKHGRTFADTFLESRAGIDGTYFLDQQKLFGTAEFRRFDYDNFTALGHNEELIDGGLIWKLSHAIDGRLEYKHEQRMVLFQDLTASTSLILETAKTATAAFNVNVTPVWRLETRGNDYELASPRSNVPGLSLHEDSILEGLRYLGVSNLSTGIEAQYLTGKYNHDPGALNPNYHQTSLALAATYVISGLTNFTGNLGYTKRVDPTNAGLSGITGSMAYQHSLTGKTSVNLQVARALSTYITTAGNEIDTSAAATLRWQTTYKLLLKAGYGYTYSR